MTGAFDDACASWLGGAVVTDNRKNELLKREPMDPNLKVVIHVPPFQIRKAGLPRERISAVADIAEMAFQMALKGDYLGAMKLNGLCYASAMKVDQDMAFKALELGARSAGLSGTGPATAILVDSGQARKIPIRHKIHQRVHNNRHIQRCERMRLLVRPSEIGGTLSASPSKSYTHRAMVLALLGHGTSRLDNVLLGGDTLATLDAVRKLGGTVSFEGERCIIEGGELRCPDDVIDTANSGTTIRIMAGIASLLPCHTVLTGDDSIRRRPMQPLISALTELGVECFSTRGNGLAPLVVRGPNTGRETHIAGDISSQFISSLLISSPLKDVDTDIHITTELKSRPYVEITMDMMARFGTKCTERDGTFHVPGGQSYRARTTWSR